MEEDSANCPSSKARDLEKAVLVITKLTECYDIPYGTINGAQIPKGKRDGYRKLTHRSHNYSKQWNVSVMNTLPSGAATYPSKSPNTEDSTKVEAKSADQGSESGSPTRARTQTIIKIVSNQARRQRDYARRHPELHPTPPPVQPVSPHKASFKELGIGQINEVLYRAVIGRFIPDESRPAGVQTALAYWPVCFMNR